jgi:hypothetical protein
MKDCNFLASSILYITCLLRLVGWNGRFVVRRRRAFVILGMLVVVSIVVVCTTFFVRLLVTIVGAAGIFLSVRLVVLVLGKVVVGLIAVQVAHTL